MKILVTGGAGFIGSAVVRHIISNTQSVVVNLDKLTYAGNLESLAGVSTSDRYAFEQVDICNRAELDLNCPLMHRESWHVAWLVKYLMWRVDICKSSPTFGKWVGVNLSAENKRQLWIPEWFAHDVITKTETAVVLYKTTNYYRPDFEISICWHDQ